jgi:hypothetical protein
VGLAVTIDAQGREVYWVLRLDAPADAVHGCNLACCAPHDQVTN